MLSSEQRAAIVLKAHECIELLNKKYNALMKPCAVSFALKGKVAGTAHVPSWTININEQLAVQNFDEQLNDTVPHEVAHLACGAIYPETLERAAPRIFRRADGRTRIRRAKRDIHGAQWQEIMYALGVKPTRCHNMDVGPRKIKSTSEIWTCSGCKHDYVISGQRHKKVVERLMSGDETPIWCGKCGRGISLSHKPKPKMTINIGPVEAAINNSTSMSKMELCLTFFKANQHLDRQQMLKVFETNFQMTRAGASTYYYTCQQKVKKQ